MENENICEAFIFTITGLDKSKPDELSFRIEQNEGPIPHFHIYSKKGQVITRIELFRNAYKREEI